MVVADTNILIDYLRSPQSADSCLIKLLKSKPHQNIGVSIVTIQELYAGQSSKIPEKESFFMAIMNYFKILPYENEVAKLAGEIMRDAKSQIQFADAAIAATTVINNAQLATLNQKDFSGIKNLELVK